MKRKTNGLQPGFKNVKERVALLEGLVEQNRDLPLTARGGRDKLPLKQALRKGACGSSRR